MTIYTMPEVAMVGLTEEQARLNHEIVVGKFNFVIMEEQLLLMKITVSLK